MRNTLLKLSAFCVGMFFFTSCIVTKHYVGQIIKKEDLDNPEKKSVVVTVSDNVDLKDFKKTFEKNYKDNDGFVSSYLGEFANELAISRLFERVDKRGVNNFETLKNETSADYIIDIPFFEINNRVEVTQRASANPNFGGMQTTSTEYCVINVKVVVYDVKKKRRIVEFLSTGESAVFLFDFKNTFNQAKKRSMIHIINYLKTGKTEYDKY